MIELDLNFAWLPLRSFSLPAYIVPGLDPGLIRIAVRSLASVRRWPGVDANGPRIKSGDGGWGGCGVLVSGSRMPPCPAEDRACDRVGILAFASCVTRARMVPTDG